MSDNNFSSRLKHAWNAFLNRDPTEEFKMTTGSVSYGFNPYRSRLSFINERSIITPVYNRLAVDASSIDIKHVQLNENGRYVSDIKSSLNNCLTCQANKDQTGKAFIQDAVTIMLDEGVAAIVPVDTNINPNTGSFDIDTMRVGRITDWYPDAVRINLYNDRTGLREDILMKKSTVAIIENPFYMIMNEPNSTLQRLKRKLNLLDVVDEQSGSGKLDLIIQLPYVIKSKAREAQAEARKKAIEDQLANSKYGIAYTDGTERITQLNRAVDNNLMAQVEYLTTLFYSQLGITAEIMNGTADENTMNNYMKRTIEPIVSAITDNMAIKFLTKNARTRMQTIKYFNDPFKLVTVSSVSEMADKFTRNEILAPNEFRQIIGMKPSDDPYADELRNRNISISSDTDRYDIDGNVVEEGKE
ncbi:MAG: phage portal protein [Bacillus sp. (in: Bacteria)]|nr:phage portal protein [Bacillus sp. (in: firmicutes)]